MAVLFGYLSSGNSAGIISLVAGKTEGGFFPRPTPRPYGRVPLTSGNFGNSGLYFLLIYEPLGKPTRSFLPNRRTAAPPSFDSTILVRVPRARTLKGQSLTGQVAWKFINFSSADNTQRGVSLDVYKADWAAACFNASLLSLNNNNNAVSQPRDAIAGFNSKRFKFYNGK